MYRNRWYLDLIGGVMFPFHGNMNINLGEKDYINFFISMFEYAYKI